MKFKFRHADKIVGLFTLVALFLLLVVIFFAGINQKWFTKKLVFYSQFTSAEGLKVGMGVNLRGFEIGRVRNLSLNEDNQVDLEFFIYEKYHDRVLRDSVVALPAGLLGAASALAFYPGLNSGDPLVEGSFIPSTQISEGKHLLKSGQVERPDGGDAISDLMDRMPDILDSLNVTLNSITDLALSVNFGISGHGDAAMASSFRNIQEITRKLDSTLSDVNRITGSLAVLAADLEDPTGLIPTLLDPSGSLDTLLNDNNVLWNQITSILNQIDSTFANLNTLTSDLQKVSPQIAVAMEEVIMSLKDAQKVMEGLKNNPMLKNGISEDKIPANPGSDLREVEF